MAQDDLSKDSVSPVGIDLVAGTLAEFTRGGVVSPASSTLAPVTANTITGVSTANPGVVTTSAAHGLVTGQVVGIEGVGGATQANGVWTVTVLSTTTFSIPVNVTGTFSGSGAFWVPALPSVEMSGHGTARLDLVVSAVSGTSPSITMNIYTSYDNGVTDTWRSVAAFTAVTAAGTSRKVFTGLDRWIIAVPEMSGSATPSETYSLSGEIV
jgi:hypothetical protein